MSNSSKTLVKLSAQGIRQGLDRINLKGVPHWQLITKKNSEQQALQVHYQLKTFKTTWKFLNLVADHANRLRHHPTITTTYNKVDIEITTHDIGNNISDKDLSLAEAIHTEYLQLTHNQ